MHVKSAFRVSECIMVEQLDKDSFRIACVALRTAIVKRAHGDLAPMRAPLRALMGLEQAALNAPDNHGWLRKRRIELRNELDGFAKRAMSEADELHLLYENVAAILRGEPRRWEPIRTTTRLRPEGSELPNDVR